MTRAILWGIAWCVAATPLAAQAPVDGFVGRTYYAGRRDEMPYRLFIPPGYDKAKAYPLVIWLHGAGGAGDDNRRQIQDDQTLGTHIWTRPDNQARHPAFVLVPQTTGVWVSAFEPMLNNQERLVIAILGVLAKEFSIDSKRIYLTGQSNGGYGTWDLIIKRPDLFAAAIPLCGGGDTTRASRLVHLPIWAFHGAIDQTIPVTESRNMIAAIQRAGGTPRYTEYVGIDHNVWIPAFKEPGLVDWLFAQHR